MTEKMDAVFVETDGESWAVQRTDPDGEVIHAAKGSGADRAQGANREVHQKSRADRHYFVVWQVERVIKELGGSPFEGRAVVDLYQLAWLPLSIGEIPDRKFASLAKWCDVSGPFDTVEDRVRAVRECYGRLVHRIEVGLKVESVGREVMTELTTKAVQVFGRLMK